MPHKQKHRGQNSKDPVLFHERWIPILNEAVKDLSWLRTRGYSDTSSLKLVGDRYRLTQRQRKAIYRAYCSDLARDARINTEKQADEIQGQDLAIDGYNLLINIESGLGGGLIFKCRDGSYRDIASIHSTYRRVEETIPALQLIGKSLIELKAGKVYWYLDRPISNSGKLRLLMLAHAQVEGFDWEVNLVNNPDKTIVRETSRLAISADGWVLDHAVCWFNLSRYIIDKLPEANIIDLSGSL